MVFFACAHNLDVCDIVCCWTFAFYSLEYSLLRNDGTPLVETMRPQGNHTDGSGRLHICNPPLSIGNNS